MPDERVSYGAGGDVVDGPDLAGRIRARDPDAMQEVVRAYLPQILRAARGAGLDDQLAEDVTQSTFATFIESAPRFEGRSRVRTWLFGILYRKVAEARRRRARDHAVEDIDAVFEQQFDSGGGWTRPPRPVDAEVYASEVRRNIEECLDAVPTKQRMAFVFREIEELDSEEICKILEVTRTNFGVLLHRARARLRICLEDRGLRE
jgi:RNA polymerase sigma-70 factor (ECF subfamily)